MIQKVRLRNFKSIHDETFDLTDFDLLVGANNCGKSTVLQAMAIWQYCVDQFRRSKRSGRSGIQIVLPNFTALPLPEFALLWKDKTERRYPKIKGRKKQEYIVIEIEVFWLNETNNETSLNVQLRYQSPQSVYAIPQDGWTRFKELEGTANIPRIVYVPPFSGLEPEEAWLDDGNVRKNVGKAQPGSVLRNLLYRVIDNSDTPISKNNEWKEIVERVREWFGVDLNPPKYEKGESTHIEVSYKSTGKDFDIISGGSGFHQILTLLAFFYGYPGVTTILFDEPDAHLHVNLQRQILSYFSKKNTVQFLIATHAEEFIRGVDVSSIVSLLSGKARRVESSQAVITAMSEVDNMVVVETKQSPFVLYVEGEDDERILSSWAEVLGRTELLRKFHVQHLGGGAKDQMNERANTHFAALQIINPDVKRVELFDYDNEGAWHPNADNTVVREWTRTYIENYLLVPDAWTNAVLDAQNLLKFDLFNDDYRKIIDDFFIEQGISLPSGFNWQNVKANIFQAVNGKKILFENSDSLFQRLRAKEDLKITREKVANNMASDMLHEDVVGFFDHLSSTVG